MPISASSISASSFRSIRFSRGFFCEESNSDRQAKPAAEAARSVRDLEIARSAVDRLFGRRRQHIPPERSGTGTGKSRSGNYRRQSKPAEARPGGSTSKCQRFQGKCGSDWYERTIRSKVFQQPSEPMLFL